MNFYYTILCSKSLFQAVSLRSGRRWRRSIHTSPNMFSAVVLSCAYARDMKHMAWGLAVSRLADVLNTSCHKKYFWRLVNYFLSDNSLSLVDRELLTLTEIPLSTFTELAQLLKSKNQKIRLYYYLRLSLHLADRLTAN